MENLFDLSFELHDKLLNSKEFINLKEKERLMNDDCKTRLLLEKYHKLQEQSFNDKTQSIIKEMHQLKLELDENELVIAYKKAYKDYQILVGNITDIVFKDFYEPNLIDKIIRAK